MFKLKKVHPGVFKYNAQYFTKNLLKEKSFPGDAVLKYKNLYFREWKGDTCKIASMLPSLKEFPFVKHSTILCLGDFPSSSISYLSDIIGIPGMILVADPSAKTHSKLSQVMQHRKNLLSVIVDYSAPENLEKDLSGFYIHTLLQENPSDSIDSFLNVSRKYLHSNEKAVLIQKKTENEKGLEKAFKSEFNDVLILEIPHFKEYYWMSGVKK